MMMMMMMMIIIIIFVRRKLAYEYDQMRLTDYVKRVLQTKTAREFTQLACQTGVK